MLYNACACTKRFNDKINEKETSITVHVHLTAHANISLMTISMIKIHVNKVDEHSNVHANWCNDNINAQTKTCLQYKNNHKTTNAFS